MLESFNYREERERKSEGREGFYVECTCVRTIDLNDIENVYCLEKVCDQSISDNTGSEYPIYCPRCGTKIHIVYVGHDTFVVYLDKNLTKALDTLYNVRSTIQHKKKVLGSINEPDTATIMLYSYIEDGISEALHNIQKVR
jgi:hypothetical protein